MRRLWIILAGSLLIKMALMVHLDGRVYTDVVRSVDFGLGLETGLVSIRTHVDNTKSFLGPVLSTALYHLGGVWAIKLYNLAAFACLFLTMSRIGRDRYEKPVIFVALFLFAFYAGGHRNVAAGEVEDNTASLLFALGMLVYLQTRRTWPASLLFGLALLMKFWIAIFLLGFGVFLMAHRRWRNALGAALGSALPFLVITVIDGGATLKSLLLTVERQQGYSDWPLIGIRLLSTGLLLAVLAGASTVVRRRNEPNKLFFCLIATYLAYVVMFRDAHAVTFVMMLCLVFAGFLIAQFLLDSKLVAAAPRTGAVRLALVLGGFLIAGAGIAWQNLYRDTHPFRVHPGKDSRPVGALPALRAPIAVQDRPL